MRSLALSSFYDRYRGEFMDAGYHKILPSDIRWGGLDPLNREGFDVRQPQHIPLAAALGLGLFDYGTLTKSLPGIGPLVPVETCSPRRRGASKTAFPRGAWERGFVGGIGKLFGHCSERWIGVSGMKSGSYFVRVPKLNRGVGFSVD